MTIRGNQAMERAVTTAVECFRICEEMLPHSLEQGGRYVEGEHIKLLVDCAAVCHTTAAFMERESRYHTEMARICADVCEATANTCAQFSGDEQMMRCEKATRRCAEVCREMAGVAA